MRDYSKLSDRELDAVVAERLMGWEWWASTGAVCPFSQLIRTKQDWPSRLGMVRVTSPRDGDDVLSDSDEYSTDRNAAAEVLAEIERRGIVEDFIANMYDEVLQLNCDTMKNDFRLLNATPRQLCLAALRAVGDSDAQ